ncbi:MAG: DNA polymerase I [Clostridia bacterium]|nr:DNA polymerase I [Clostridia bacterium]
MNKTLLVIDGNSIINRAYYGIRLLSTRDGLHTNAIYGTVNILEKHLETLNPDYAAVAFDVHAPTFRHKMYADYKAGRRPTPEELLKQFAPCKEVLRAMGLHVLEKEGYEADDILGTLASAAAKEGDRAFVLTGDRDALQLISDDITVLLAANPETITFDRAAFTEKYGVEPTQFVDVKAVMGDKSDNIPGVAGIGEVGALKLISTFGSLENLYENLEETKEISEKNKEKLRADRENAFFSQTLARIDRAVPGLPALSDLTRLPIDRDALYTLFSRLEFGALIKRFALTAPDHTVAAAALDATEISAEELPSKLGDGQFAFYDTGERSTFYDGKVLYRTKTDYAAFAPLLSSDRLICFDRKALCAKTAPADYLPSAHAFDVMLAAYALNAGESAFTPERLAAVYLGEVPDGEVCADLIFRMADAVREKFALDPAAKEVYGIESDLCLVLYEMERDGFMIDRDGLRAYGETLTNLQSDCAERIYMLAGGQFNINSPKQLGEVLFERLGLPAAKKTKTGYSTNAEILEKLRPYHPIIEDVLDYRKVAKLYGTYVEGLLKVADGHGVIHTTFKQTGTATGRLSSAEPNLQNIPIRTDLGHELRRYFVPRDGDHVLIDADYSQIELRLLAHIAGDGIMQTAFREGEDIHASTAAAVFGLPLSAVTPELRGRAKAVNFGIVYGIGDYSLAMDLGISKKQAAAYIQSYLTRFSAIDRYLKNTVAAAYEKGYVDTIFGRRRYIPELKAQNKMTRAFGERVAMNSPIQGSAADIIKIAMIRTRNALKAANLDAHLILQVHDELVVEASRADADSAAAILRREMENAVSLSVPLSVELTVGQTWYDNK